MLSEDLFAKLEKFSTRSGTPKFPDVLNVPPDFSPERVKSPAHSAPRAHIKMNPDKAVARPVLLAPGLKIWDPRPKLHASQFVDTELTVLQVSYPASNAHAIPTQASHQATDSRSAPIVRPNSSPSNQVQTVKSFVVPCVLLDSTLTPVWLLVLSAQSTSSNL